jgi:hypothetical protein
MILNHIHSCLLFLPVTKWGTELCTVVTHHSELKHYNLTSNGSQLFMYVRYEL